MKQAFFLADVLSLKFCEDGNMNLKNYLREYADFPKPGILFKDISPLLKSPEAMRYVTNTIHEHFKNKDITLIAGIESRGFGFASLLAQRFDAGFLMIRKRGKLPGDTHVRSYDIEYGNAEMEIQRDAVTHGQKVLIIDDLLATGGTAKAAAHLVERLGGVVVGFAFVIELTDLAGRAALHDYSILSLVTYDK